MGERASIESVEALTEFRADLCKIGESVYVALAEAEAEINRTLAWLQQDQRSYWKRQQAKRAELFTRAKSVLKRKQLMKTPLGGRYSTIEEEKALAQAERSLEEAKQKQEYVKRWTRLLDEESFAYKATAQGLCQMVETDIPNALAGLANMILALEAYATPGTPTRQASVATSDAAYAGEMETESVAREAPTSSPLAAEQTVAALRNLTPNAEKRALASTADSPPELPTPGDVDDVLAAIGGQRVPAAPEDRVVFARGLDSSPRIYLERVAAGEWFVGSVDERGGDEYLAIEASELLASRPDLAGLLSLPVAALAVLSGEGIETVLSPSDEVLWPAEGSAK